MDWFRQKKEAVQSDQMSENSSQKLTAVNRSLNIFLKSSDPDDADQFIKLVQKSEIQGTPIINQLMKKMMQLIYFRELVKFFTEDKNEQNHKLMQQHLERCNGAQKQAFQKLQKNRGLQEAYLESLKGHPALCNQSNPKQKMAKEKHLRHFYELLSNKLDQHITVRDNIDMIYDRVGKGYNEASLSQKVQTIGRKFVQFEKINQKVREIRPLLKEIAMKQIQQEREISMILNGEQDETNEFERLYFVIKQLNESHQVIRESIKRKQQQIQQKRQELQRLGIDASKAKQLRLDIESFEKQLLSLNENADKFKQGIQRKINEQNVDYSSSVIDIQKQRCDNEIEEKQIVKQRAILVVEQSINSLFQLINKLKKQLQSKQERITELEGINDEQKNKKHEYDLQLRKELREQSEKDYTLFKQRQKQLRQKDDEKLKEELKKLRENEHKQIIEELRRKRDMIQILDLFISYDDYFIIFGNSEIRIRSGEKSLFSNFQ